MAVGIETVEDGTVEEDTLAMNMLKQQHLTRHMKLLSTPAMRRPITRTIIMRLLNIRHTITTIVMREGTTGETAFTIEC